MKVVADKLEELDKYLSEKKEAERWVIILLVAGVVGYLVYMYLYPYAEDKFNQSQLERQKLEKKVAEDEKYLRSITIGGDRDFYIKDLNKKIRRKKDEIKSYKEKIALLDKNFQKLAAILFNQSSWSKFLESISDRANINDIELIALSNNYVDQEESFGHVLEIGIRCRGSFQNILKFMNDIEQSRLVTDVYESDLYVDGNSEGGLIADFNISVWGVNH